MPGHKKKQCVEVCLDPHEGSCYMEAILPDDMGTARKSASPAITDDTLPETTVKSPDNPDQQVSDSPPLFPDTSPVSNQIVKQAQPTGLPHNPLKRSAEQQSLTSKHLQTPNKSSGVHGNSQSVHVNYPSSLREESYSVCHSQDLNLDSQCLSEASQVSIKRLHGNSSQNSKEIRKLPTEMDFDLDASQRHLPRLECLKEHDGSLVSRANSKPQNSQVSEACSTQQYSTSQTDSSLDLGYCSYQDQEGTLVDQEGTLMDQEPLYQEQGATGFNSDWSNIDDDIYLQTEDEMDRLLHQFERFFTERFESELRHFHKSVATILQEQQNHVRQIVRIGSRFQQSQSSLEDLIEIEDNQTPSTAAENGGASSTPVVQITTPCSCVKAPPPPPPEASHSTQKEKLLDLMSLSCAVSTMLTRKEYRT